ncbi:hypothetical protein D3875_13650 [Deinococcus cavernae]|uniref:Uncharacterized protein n=1 Tax=Deinococcus cavernae TaxID=2320857 RepID=A0A418V8L8_9DEIO|nr:hypothetical protein [Deinococcus cavernae]RJF72439.1 hypothetical protein D3875_13650 [Deinococcus cavernae]
MTDDRDKIIPVDPSLSARQPETRDEPVQAEQGPPPADYAERPASGAPLPNGERLSGSQVTDLLGTEEADTVNGTNRALQEAGGLDPDASQN